MTRQKIAVDIDDVLSATAEGFAAYSNQRWGGDHKAEDFTEELAVFWRVDLDEAINRSHEYHNSDAAAAFRHHNAAVPVLRELHKKYDLIVVTSRWSTLQSVTTAWLHKHFPGIFDEVRFAGIWGTDQTKDDVHLRLKRTKAEICREIGADYLIDDQPKHCIGAAGAGLKALLFGDYKWNRDVELPNGVVRVRDWKDVARYFGVQS
jgi:5'(3')-deoxyribonucleotidase